MSDHARVDQFGAEVLVDVASSTETARIDQVSQSVLIKRFSSDEPTRVDQAGIELLVLNPLDFRKVIGTFYLRASVQGEVVIHQVSGMCGGGRRSGFASGTGQLGISFML